MVKALFVYVFREQESRYVPKNKKSSKELNISENIKVVISTLTDFATCILMIAVVFTLNYHAKGFEISAGLWVVKNIEPCSSSVKGMYFDTMEVGCLAYSISSKLPPPTMSYP